MEAFNPPNIPPLLDSPKMVKRYTKSVFLAGSIEMGAAENWQKVFEIGMKNEDGVICNPRRPDWDSSWEQHKDNPHFREQVEWELDMLEECSIIAMYLDPNTTSPISLLELGLHSYEDKLIVCCPEGFHRKGNVDIVCEKYGIKQVPNLLELMQETKRRLREINP